MPDPRSPDEKISAQERAAEIVRLHRAGLPFRDIGAQMGITGARAHQIWTKTLRDVPAPEVQALRVEVAERLDENLRRCLEVLENPMPMVTSKGEVLPFTDQRLVLDTVAEIRKGEETRARLFGLNAPVRSEVTATQSVRYEVVGVDLEALS